MYLLNSPLFVLREEEKVIIHKISNYLKLVHNKKKKITKLPLKYVYYYLKNINYKY